VVKNTKGTTEAEREKAKKESKRIEFGMCSV
jgi:hypothetical protein